MKQPTKSELIALVCELGGVASQMHSEYANDTTPGRADAMTALDRHARELVEAAMARLPFDTMKDAVDKHRFTRPDTKSLRRA